MFKQEKVYVGADVLEREALCKRLTVDHGAILVNNIGDQDVIHVLNSFEGVCNFLTSLNNNTMTQ